MTRDRGASDDGGRGQLTRTEDVSAHRLTEQVLVRRFQLQIVGGPDAGQVFSSQSERVLVGTHESADLRLHDRTVSRFHCELRLAGPRVLLRDTGSRNGTLIDGVCVLTAPVNDGATITVGRTTLTLRLGAEDLPIPLAKGDRFGSLVGRSASMRSVFHVLERAAATDVTVLVEGETGTGKELVAESLHRASTRRDRPLVVVDCGALTPELLKSELFGHERGAFTGADIAREGAFEAADGGTVFLDEIGELGEELQPMLLRAVESRTVKRIGANQYKRVDVRVIAATNRDLYAEVNEHRFRSDLFYRLAVLRVRMPPLRQRAEDLSLLVPELLTNLGVLAHPRAAALQTAAAYAELARHGWPGNIRELRNYLEAAVLFPQGVPDAGLQAPPASTDAPPAFDLPYRAARTYWTHEFEQRYLVEALRRHGDEVAAAARAVGLDRVYFHRLLRKHRLR